MAALVTPHCVQLQSTHMIGDVTGNITPEEQSERLADGFLNSLKTVHNETFNDITDKELSYAWMKCFLKRQPMLSLPELLAVPRRCALQFPTHVPPSPVNPRHLTTPAGRAIWMIPTLSQSHTS